VKLKILLKFPVASNFSTKQSVSYFLDITKDAERYLAVDTGGNPKYTLFFEAEGYRLSDGSSKTISLKCYED
jgi:hypothetical protein